METPNSNLAPRGREPVQAQKEVLDQIKSSDIPFILWGSWAGKELGILGKDYCPADIDVFVEKGSIDKLRIFLEEEGFETKELKSAEQRFLSTIEI